MSDSKITERALPKGMQIASSSAVYVVVEVLGAGGFGITYKVIRQSDGAIFAMKEYFPDKLCERSDGTRMSYLKTNSESIETGLSDFITEAKRLSKQNISHPNIVAVSEVFKANNTAYYIMEFIDGYNIRQYVKKNKKPLSIEQALSVMKPILQAVALLHKHTLTHLDIKHDNIVLTFVDDDTARPVLIDFGQSKHYDKKGNATSTLTNAGCSDGFAPQEQYLGLPKFTPQADVYALCATLLYMLSAQQPRKSSEINATIITQMLGDNIPERIKSAIINGMRRDKEDRTQSVAMLAYELGIDISSENSDENTTKLLKIKKPHDFDYKKYLKPILGGVVIIAVVGGVLWLASQQPTQSELLTTAIKDKNLSEVKRFADNESIRAYIPCSELLLGQDRFTESIFYAEKALKTSDSIRAKDLINTANRFISELNEHSQRDDLTPVEENVNPSENSDNNPIDTDSPAIESNQDKLLRAQKNNDLSLMLTLAQDNYAPAYYPLAEIYYKRGNLSQAKSWAQKAVSVNVNKQNSLKLLDTIANKQNSNYSNKSIVELRKLANEGVKEAYAPLSKLEYESANYDRAKELALLARKYNCETASSRKVLQDLEEEGF